MGGSQVEAVTSATAASTVRRMPEPGADLRVDTDLGAVAVRVLGRGRPTVLWHSMFVDGSSWARIAPMLLAGRQLLIVDGPGWGTSDRLRRAVRMADAVTAAARIVTELSPDAPVDWVGNAWGGHVGIELAATRPRLVRTLVAMSAPIQPISPGMRRQIRALIPVLLVAGPVTPVQRAIAAGVLTDRSARDPGTVGVIADALALAGRRSTARTVRSFILNRVDIASLLPRITAPTLFVAGDDRDEWTPEQAEAAARLVRDGRAVVVPGSRALIPLEQPEALATVIRGFWETASP